MLAQVIKSTGSWYLVRNKKNEVISCRLPGKFRLKDEKLTNPIAVGDCVVIEFEDGQESAVIQSIENRKNYITRLAPKKRDHRHIIAANLDLAALIVTLKMPRTSIGFIDRFLVTATAFEIPSILVFNKSDIYKDKDRVKYNDIKNAYDAVGYECFLVSAKEEDSFYSLNEKLKDKTTLVAGHSGVGKSTLINKLIPELNIQTREISKFSSKGTHTTTHAEMFQLPFGGNIIDTPGIKEFGVLDIEPEELSLYYPEMLEARERCGFYNCMHITEPKCEVLEEVKNGNISKMRHNSYAALVEDLKTQRDQKFK